MSNGTEIIVDMQLQKRIVWPIIFSLKLLGQFLIEHISNITIGSK